MVDFSKFRVKVKFVGEEEEEEEEEVEGELMDMDLLDIGREVIKGSIHFNQQYDSNGNNRHRERQRRLHNYLGGIDHHEPPDQSGHISFIPNLSGVWEDSVSDDRHHLYVSRTVDEARSEARGRAEHIVSDWKLLENIVQRHEATIQKRWLEKTREKRKEILLKAWPHMPLYHRPDFQDFKSKEKVSQNPKRDAYLWPYINIEDLTKPRLLPLFLNSRGRNEPGAFAEADYVACRFGFPARALTLTKLDGFIMRFLGRQTADTYGGIYPKLCEGNPQVCEWEKAEDNIVPGAGLIILEVQERIYSFLVRCCLLILHDIPKDALVNSTVPIQPEPELVLQNEATLPSLATIASEAPYRLQSELDLRRLQSIVQAKLSAAEDHLWALREDPQYFASAFWEQANHSHQLVGETIMLDGDNWARSFRQEFNREYFPALFTQEVVCHSLKAVETWRDLNHQLDKVLQLREKNGSSRITRNNIRREFANAVMKLEHDLEMYLSEPVSRLQDNVFSSPPVRVLLLETCPDYKKVAEGEGYDLDVISDVSVRELFWILTSLWNEDQRKLSGLGLLADELGQLLERSTTARNCISPLIAREISDLSVLAQCATFVEKYYSQAVRSRGEQGQPLCELFSKRMKGWFAMYRANWKQSLIGSLGDPSYGNFAYPVDKPGSRETLEATRKAEKHLDILWKEIDRELKIAGAMPISLRDLKEKRDLKRTRVPLTRKEEQELLKPLSEIDLDREQRTERTVVRDEPKGPKTKAKTKGIARAVEAEPTHGNPPLRQEESNGRLFAVDKRALKVFRTLFYTPGAVGQPGEIEWANFLHAMTSVGFSAQKLYGSVWQFSPEKLEVERSIQFHEPHPSSKLPYHLARVIGRRLTRAYEWLGENFVLKQ